MTSWMGRPLMDEISRPVPLTTPVVRVWSRPKGLPMANTCRGQTQGVQRRGARGKWSSTGTGRRVRVLGTNTYQAGQRVCQWRTPGEGTRGAAKARPGGVRFGKNYTNWLHA